MGDLESAEAKTKGNQELSLSQESKPLALRLRGGLALPLLSTLPTNSTCLSQSDPCK